MMSRSTHFQRNTRALSRIGALAEGDLRIGGEIRTHYKPDGQLGDAEGIVNEILAFEPERMLAIRVKRAPASLPNRDALAGAWRVLYFSPAGENMTHVRVVGPGYNDTPGLAGDPEILRRGRSLDARLPRQAVLARLPALQE